MDFKTLEAVVSIHRHGGFRAAADHLHTTQPALSHRIKQLEEQLGTVLFERKRPRVVPTESGRLFVRYAEQLLELQSQMIASIGKKEALQGLLRIGVVESIVHTWLPDFLSRMSAEFPKLTLELDVDDSPTLRERLTDLDIDLALIAGPYDSTLGQGLSLASSPVRFVCAPSYPLSRRPTLRDLARCPIVSFSRRSQLYPLVDDLFRGLGVPMPRIHRSSSMATITQMALDGLGVAVIPTAIVRKRLNSRELVEIDLEPRLPDLAYWAVWSRTMAGNVAEQAGAIAASVANMTIHR